MGLDLNTKRDIERNVLGAVRNVLLVVLCAGMLGMGMVKLVGVPELVERFAEWGFSRWMVAAIGALELAISILLFIKPTRSKSLFAMVLLLLGAIATHLVHQDYYGAIGPFAVLNAALLLGFLTRFLDKK